MARLARLSPARPAAQGCGEMAIQWPPRARANLDLKPGDATVRTQMESGHQRVRRISANVPEVVTARWTLTGKQMQVWRSWWKHTVLDGAAYFQCELTDGSQLVTASARPREGTYAATTSNGGHTWEVSCELEVEDLPIMSEAELEAYLAG